MSIHEDEQRARWHGPSAQRDGGRLLDPGDNCWRIERADQFAFLIDGESYFRALREAVLAARRSILVIAWDIDTRVRLVPDDGPEPTRVGELFDYVARRPDGPTIHVLCWDPLLMYALEREWLASLRWRISTHARVHFQLDRTHPLGGSLHEKLVVVDDCLAFVGGIDVTSHRWDTRAHLPHDPRRLMPDGKRYGPFHDLHCVGSGPFAAAIGELARTRWYRATGETLPRPAEPLPPIWPASLTPQLRGAPVAILRAHPPWPDESNRIDEIARFNQQAIAAAERCIFIETMYLTSQLVCSALCERLDATTGPEVVVVISKRSEGWLEHATMDAKRHEVVEALRRADRRGRLGIYYPSIDRDRVDLGVHSKLLIVDDRLLRLGSSNLTNRSLATDGECDIALESSGLDDVGEAIARMQSELIGEHLGCAPEAIASRQRELGSWLAAIELLRLPPNRAERTLAPLSNIIAPAMELGPPALAIADPLEPIEPSALLGTMVGPSDKSASRRAWVLLGLVALMLAVAFVWRFTSVGRSFDADSVGGWMRVTAATPQGMILVMILFAVVTSLGVPVTLAIGGAALALGPWRGLVVSLLGTVGSAAAGYWLGKWLGYERTARLGGSAFERLRRAFRHRGVLTITVVRLVPIAPYAVVNAVAGALGVSFRDYVIGSMLGMIPGMIGLSLLIDRILAALRSPSAVTIILLVVVLICFVSLIVAYGRWAARRRNPATD